MTKVRKKVGLPKNGTLRYVMIAGTQLEMELLEIVALIYSFSSKAGCSMPSTMLA